MTAYEAATVSYDSVTTEPWDAPALSDFETDELTEIADHFVVAKGGFPPEKFSDLELPVVDTDGELNLEGIRRAYSGGRSVKAIDGMSEGTRAKAKSVLQDLAEAEFSEGLDGETE
ncbi:hypothetical protein KTS45_00850 [Halomicroarcula limicola]|uniref:Uncharacterized protein n=1 Tax=Haloarcula limicola TaxID=1429915 RepID=A0A8J8C275_9EURY|nr:hypothetical protein [Halomicroarcula limicola]MBV0922737.1 hypothetical protein [Halomicroarcula limicola]